MFEKIVFVILVILAVGAGVWVWHMEVSGTPILPPNTPSDASGDATDAETDKTA